MKWIDVDKIDIRYKLRECLSSWILYFLFSLILFAFKITTIPNLNDEISIEREADIMEYQSIAINLLNYGKFPYSGFHGDRFKYHIDRENCDISGAAFFKVLNEQPLIVNLGKPPGYPLFLGLVYGIFGNYPFYARAANIFMVCFMGVFMIYMGLQLQGTVGWFLGLLACILYTNNSWEFCYEIYPNILISFIIYMLFLFNVKNENKHLFLTGVLLALMLLIKGNSIFIAVIYFIYNSYKCFIKRDGAKFIVPIVGFCSLILPWTIYANVINQKTQIEQKAWLEKINQTIEPIQPTISLKDFDTDSSLVYNMVLRVYSMYAKGNEPIIITKHVSFIMSDELISVHNELTAKNGGIFHEWRYMPNLYCNKYDKDDPVLIRIAKFYVNNPTYIYSIVKAKFLHTESFSYTFYKICLWMLGLLTIGVGGHWLKAKMISRLIILFLVFLGIYYPFSTIMLVFLLLGLVFHLLFYFKEQIKIPVFILISISSHFIITIILFAPPRFIEIISPVSIFSAFVLSYANLKLVFAKTLRPLFKL